MRARCRQIDHVRHRYPLMMPQLRRPRERYARNGGITIKCVGSLHDIASAVPNTPYKTASSATVAPLTTPSDAGLPQFPRFSVGSSGTSQKSQIVEFQTRAAERRRGCVLSCVGRGLVASWVHHQLPSSFGPSEATEATFGLPKNPSVRSSPTSLASFIRLRAQPHRSPQNSTAAFATSNSICQASRIGPVMPSRCLSLRFAAVIACGISE